MDIKSYDKDNIEYFINKIIDNAHDSTMVIIYCKTLKQMLGCDKTYSDERCVRSGDK